MSEPIKPLEKRHAAAAAQLHRTGIDTGFLSSLGQRFLTQLYSAIPSCPAGFGYVWEEADSAVLGFIACATGTGRLYKQALVRRGLHMAWPLARFLLSPRTLRRIFQTLRYPAQVGGDLPDAELLSISVSSAARGKGVGTALMQAAQAEFQRRGVEHFKLAVWAGNEPANRFYRGCGFRLALQREHHGMPMNVYVIGPLTPADPPKAV